MNLSFDDVLIKPQFSTVVSRKDVSTEIHIPNIGTLSLGVVSSNMDSVTGVDMSQAMIRNGSQACLHRFQSIDDNIKMLMDGSVEHDVYVERPWVSLGLGIKELDRALALYGNNASVFVIDVAHGASMEVVKQVKALRKIVSNYSGIIVGNFATAQSLRDFSYHLGEVHVDAVKVGIGGGSACTTRMVTGCGNPTFSSIIDCSSVGIPIIADGGMRSSGDISKAIAAGASAVMLGKMLAGSYESPGKLYDMDTGEFLVGYSQDFLFAKVGKSFRGSASAESYKAQGKEASHRAPEGESFLVPYTGPAENTLINIKAGLQSAMSYVGAHTIDEFQERAEFAQITNSGLVESGPHGKL